VFLFLAWMRSRWKPTHHQGRQERRDALWAPSASLTVLPIGPCPRLGWAAGRTLSCAPAQRYASSPGNR